MCPAIVIERSRLFKVLHFAKPPPRANLDAGFPKEAIPLEVFFLFRAKKRPPKRNLRVEILGIFHTNIQIFKCIQNLEFETHSY